MNTNQIYKNDSIIEQYLSSNDKNASKKTLTFQYFNNDLKAFDEYINNNLYSDNPSLNIKLPKAQLEFSF